MAKVPEIDSNLVEGVTSLPFHQLIMVFLRRYRTFLTFRAPADKQFCVFLMSGPVESLFFLSEILPTPKCPANDD